jgi:hypothetical protein
LPFWEVSFLLSSEPREESELLAWELGQLINHFLSSGALLSFPEEKFLD